MNLQKTGRIIGGSVSGGTSRTESKVEGRGEEQVSRFLWARDDTRGAYFLVSPFGARRARARDRLPGTTRKLGNSRISGGEFFVNANWSLAFEPRCFPSRFLFLLLNREEATMFKYRWKDPKSMLVKAVKIIGRIFFRPGRSVSFFSVSVPTITGSRSFVICATILVGRGEGGTGSRLFAHPNAQGAAEIYLQPDSRDAISRDKLG